MEQTNKSINVEFPTFEIPKGTFDVFLTKIGQSNNGKHANPRMPILVTVGHRAQRGSITIL